MKLLDFTHTLQDNMVAYSAEETPHINTLCTVDSDGYKVNKLEITTHTCTHVDSPSHMLKNGTDIDNISLEMFCGNTLIIDCSNISQTEIPLSILKNYDLNHKDFILFYTGQDKFWNSSKFLYDYKYPSFELCNYLCSLKLKGIGIDTISIDRDNSVKFENHHLLFKNNMLIIENLCNLSQGLNKNLYMYLFPLKIKNGDGSPVRVVAKTL